MQVAHIERWFYTKTTLPSVSCLKHRRSSCYVSFLQENPVGNVKHLFIKQFENNAKLATCSYLGRISLQDDEPLQDSIILMT